jgi:hypothetical protein
MSIRCKGLGPAAVRPTGRSDAGRSRHFGKLLWALGVFCLTIDAGAGGTIEFGDAVLELREGMHAPLVLLRTGDTSSPASALVELDVADHTATPNLDFNLALPGGVVEFAAGEFFKLIDVTMLSDAELEGTEHQNVVLRSPLGAQVGRQDRACSSTMRLRPQPTICSRARARCSSSAKARCWPCRSDVPSLPAARST